MIAFLLLAIFCAILFPRAVVTFLGIVLGVVFWGTIALVVALLVWGAYVS